MISIDYKNTARTLGKGFSRNFKKSSTRLVPFIRRVEKRKQGFYTILDDATMVKNILAYAKGARGKFRFIVVLGIGGSALGTTAIAQSLQHLFHHDLPHSSAPRLFVLDNIDPTLIKEVEDVINLRQTLFVVVSKSGTNTEPLAQYFYFRKKIERLKLSLTKHFVFVTDGATGLLRSDARANKIPFFAIPANVGGRFSVLSAVGLLPAALLGVDIKSLLAGAKDMRKRFFSSHFSQNLPFQLAALQHLLYRSGRQTHVLMPYAQKLLGVSNWYRQLLAESIGKEKNNRGKRVNIGITPVNALGATDQHSQLQLYAEGPFDKFIMFVRVKNFGARLSIPVFSPKSEVAAIFRTTSFNKLIDVEYQGTARALTRIGRPNMTITIEAVNAFHLGGLFMLFEGAVAFLGEWFEINAFDQPGVELSKKITKRILAGRSGR